MSNFCDCVHRVGIETRKRATAQICDTAKAYLKSVISRPIGLPTPFGGIKASGIGRDGGDWSFDFYMEQKHVGFATGQHNISKLGT